METITKLASEAKTIDHAGVESAVRALISALGEDPDREGMRGTPDRVARAYSEIIKGYSQKPVDILKTEFASEGYDQMVVLREIDFFSTCEHHMLPFFGTATVAYLPGEDGKVVGLSKLARLVEIYARRFQIQERMTKQVADALTSILKPKGVGVVIRAQHLCMAARGVGKQRSEMLTSSLTGVFRSDAGVRGEFLQLAKAG